MAAATDLDRSALASRYRRNRARSRAIFDLLAEEAYYSRPIALRHPIVFYEGHLPGFSFNTLVKKGLGRPSIDERLEALFARGIDPHETSAATGRHTGRPLHERSGGPVCPPASWPGRKTVQQFADEADRQVIDALMHADLERPGHPLLDRAEAVFSILEHEAMHQETLLYMWHRLPFEQKRKPAGYRPHTGGSPPPGEWIEIPGGRATLGVSREAIPFGWDNEFPSAAADVPPFAIERHDVTNGRFLEFIEAGGYRNQQWWRTEDWRWIQTEAIAHPLFWERHGDRWYWRAMFELIPLPASWPVYVSLAEAMAYARWRGVRLPAEAEFQRAAFGSPESVSEQRNAPSRPASLARAARLPGAPAPFGGAPRVERVHPWGDTVPDAVHGVFDFTSWDPEPAGTHPRGASAWGVEDLVGNGWEWTVTPFAPFPGFQPMASYPEYSADFFDGEHFVMKGASPGTSRELLRPTFRNWFRARYPYVYATFRCATNGSTGR